MAVLTWDDSMRVGVTDIDLQHQELVRLIGSLNSAMADGSSHRLFLSLDVMDYLSDWLKGHIMGSDQRYAPLLHYHGVS